mmetsp:Transcript_148/g.181  ORF Transcript_148/g.181 Transcript_148/m.181 type:complete len:948 (-) Transcript_148:263-3106(-)
MDQTNQVNTSCSWHKNKLLLLLALAVVSLVVLLSVFLQQEEEEVAADSQPYLEVDHKTTSQYACTHGDKEWYICTQPEGWGALFYCPAYSDYNETELATVEWGGLGEPTPLTPCFTCPAEGSNCNDKNAEVMTAAGIPDDAVVALGNWSVWEENVYYCEQLCEFNKLGETCSRDDPCNAQELFCDYDPADVLDFENTTEGICRKCPKDPLSMCHNEEFIATREGQINCRGCILGCYGAAASKLFVDGEPILSHPIDGAKQDVHQNATGALHDCTVLTLDSNNICPGAEGKICVVDFKVQYALIWQVSDQAEKSGCVGVIAFYPGEYESPYYHSNSELLIPYVLVSDEDGTNFLNNIGANAAIEVNVFGGACYPNNIGDGQTCNKEWRCLGGDFCEYQSDPVFNEEWGFRYSSGTCRPCPVDVDTGDSDPWSCYFDTQYDNRTKAVETVSRKTVQKATECAQSCGLAGTTFTSCKFCTSEVAAFEFSVVNEEDRCIFCPANDMIHHERIVPLFRPNGVTCWQLESFFNKLPIQKSNPNCKIAQSMNYICGCVGTGYAGADMEAEQKTLVWLPRVAAILSILGSLFIIVDTRRSQLKRSKLINKILCAISVFDFIGSSAMALTSLPIPKETYIYGSNGNDATCKAQGFLMQMGTTACLLGASLAVYYNLTIRRGWSENELRRRHVVYFLLIPPIIVGFVFAGVGIPFYDNVIVWCNNSAKWWPEAPVIFAILCATIIMGDVTYDVFRKEHASSQYSGGSNKLTKMVFQQVIFFLGAFYVTWVPYLTLQTLVSLGRGYDNYGLFLAAATMVPLQGFWNFIVYARPRYFANGRGLAIVRSYISSFGKRTKAHKSTSVTKNTGQSIPEDRTNPCTSGSNSGTAKFSAFHFSSLAMETEVVPFEAYGNEQQVPPNDAPVSDANEDEPEVDANDNLDDANANLDDTRYEMLLAG